MKIKKIGDLIIDKIVIGTVFDSINTACYFLCNQPELPEAVKNLKKHDS